MPFELGIDYGCRRFGGSPLDKKSMLVLEHNKHDCKEALSDISGWDIQAHEGDFEKAITHVRSWLVAQAGAKPVGASRIRGKYLAFQEWYWDRQRKAGSSEADILEYPTSELITAMYEWMRAGQPD